MKTVFPRTKFVDKTIAINQLDHMRSELDEVQEALFGRGYVFDKVAEETCDLIHSAETLLRRLHERYGVDVAKIQERVVEKNRARGYYSK